MGGALVYDSISRRVREQLCGPAKDPARLVFPYCLQSLERRLCQAPNYQFRRFAQAPLQ